MMHRTHLSGLVAVLTPGAIALHPALVLPCVAGLWYTRSWTAGLAALIGVAWLIPRFAVVAIALVALVVVAAWSSWAGTRQSFADRWLPHGASLDGLRARLISWLYLVRHLTWRGRGSGATRYALEIAHIRSTGRAMEGGPHARNELLELVYEYGWRGGLVVAGLAGAGAIWLRVGDPWSAMAVSAVVVCAGTSPLRAARRWLAGGDGPLFGPPVRASFSVYIDAEGKAHLYGGPPMDPELQVMIARTFLNLGRAWMARYHLTEHEVAGVWRPK